MFHNHKRLNQSAVSARWGPNSAYAEAGDDDVLDADIAFHIAVLEASGNPFYAQFRNVVSTALRTSIRFTNRFEGPTIRLPQHRAVLTAIEARDPQAAHAAMSALIEGVMALVAAAECQSSHNR